MEWKSPDYWWRFYSVYEYHPSVNQMEARNLSPVRNVAEISLETQILNQVVELSDLLELGNVV